MMMTYIQASLNVPIPEITLRTINPGKFFKWMHTADMNVVTQCSAMTATSAALRPVLSLTIPINGALRVLVMECPVIAIPGTAAQKLVYLPNCAVYTHDCQIMNLYM
jgi:hypothetical protein